MLPLSHRAQSLQGFNLFDEELTIEMGWVVLNMCLGSHDDMGQQLQQALPWRHTHVLDEFWQSHAAATIRLRVTSVGSAAT